MESEEIMLKQRTKILRDVIYFIEKKYMYELRNLWFTIYKDYCISKPNSVFCFLENDEFNNYILSLDSCVKNMQEIFINYLIKKVSINKLIFGKRQPKFIKNMLDRQYDDCSFAFRNYAESFWKNKVKRKFFYRDLRAYIDDLRKPIDIDVFERLCTKCFEDCLIETIEKDNISKSENLMKINYKFY